MTLEQQFLAAEGRINRKIFILYIIAFILLAVTLAVPAFLLNFGDDDFVIEIISVAISSVLEFAVLPGIFLSTKRLHDLDKSAVFIVLYFVPLVNIILFIYLVFFKGTDGENRYGKNPLDKDFAFNDSSSSVKTKKTGKIEQKYFSTAGRLNRKPFIRYLFTVIICMAGGILLGDAVICLGDSNFHTDFMTSDTIFFLYFICMLYLYLILTIPLRFLLIRRLHDLNLSGWWIILTIILPLGYTIMSLCLMFIKGTDGENRYGRNPLEI